MPYTCINLKMHNKKTLLFKVCCNLKIYKLTLKSKNKNNKNFKIYIFWCFECFFRKIRCDFSEKEEIMIPTDKRLSEVH